MGHFEKPSECDEFYGLREEWRLILLNKTSKTYKLNKGLTICSTRGFSTVPIMGESDVLIHKISYFEVSIDEKEW